MSKRSSLSFTLFLLASDLALLIVALFLSTETRTIIALGSEGSPSAWILPIPVYGLAVMIWGLTFVFLNVYDPRRAVRLVGELQSVITASAFAFLVLTGALYLTFRDVSRLQIIYFGILYVALISAHRIGVRGFFKVVGGRSYDSRSVLIVGTGEIARSVGGTTQAYAWSGLHLVGYVSNDSGQEKIEQAVPVLGTLDQTLALVEKYSVNEVVIALPLSDQQKVNKLIYDLQALPVNLRIVPDYFDLAFLQLRIEDFGGMPLLSLKEAALNPSQRLAKRVFDLLITVVLVVLTIPLMAVIALAVKLDSPGPATFSQERVGEGGRTFKMSKFRSMVADAEKKQVESINRDSNGNILHKQYDDPRVTTVGRFLRRYSLDELPQLFNVLKGEMSLVGPRPELPWLVDLYEPWQRKRFEVPQGMTGWWQVNGRSDKPMHLNTEDDLFYIRNYSFLLDLQILWRTVGAVISRRGAF